jgi:hypothetical protein
MLTLIRARTWLLAGALLALVLPARAAEPDKYLPNDTEAIVVLNVKQILDSPLVKKHLAEKIRDEIKNNAEVSKVLEALGFDPLKDLSSITIASSGLNQDSKQAVIAHGQFDPAKFEAKAEEVAKEQSNILKVLKEGGKKLYQVDAPGQDKPMFVALIDKKTIVASNDKEQVLEAFAREAGTKKGTVKKDIQPLIEKADANQSLWLVVSGNALNKIDQVSEERAKKNLEKVESISAGFTVDKGVKLSFAVAAKNADNAKELAEEIKEGLNQIKGLVGLVAANQKELAPLVDIIGAIKVTTDESTVSLKTEVSEEVIEKGLKNQ